MQDPFYSDYDTTEKAWCVFNANDNRRFAYRSFTTQPYAEDSARKLNIEFNREQNITRNWKTSKVGR